MFSNIHIHPVAAGPLRRHEARVRRVSANPEFLISLDSWAVAEHGSRTIVGAVCAAYEVPEPRLYFHARRSMYTAATEAPRSFLVDRYGEEDVAKTEASRKPIEPKGAMRLGRTTTLMTLAHELGHHLVFALEKNATPAHGAIWVHRFDQAAETMRLVPMTSHPTTSVAI